MPEEGRRQHLNLLVSARVGQNNVALLLFASHYYVAIVQYYVLASSLAFVSSAGHGLANKQAGNNGQNGQSGQHKHQRRR